MSDVFEVMPDGTFRCVECNQIYFTRECPSCHLREEWPIVQMSFEGQGYEVQRARTGGVMVVNRATGRGVDPFVRGAVIRKFLAMEHP
jgi:hypothetical protein